MEFSDIMAGFGDLDQLFNDIGWDLPGPVGADTYAPTASEALGINFNATPSSYTLTPGIKPEPMISSEGLFELPTRHLDHSSSSSTIEAAAFGRTKTSSESNSAYQIWQTQQQHPQFSMDPPDGNACSGHNLDHSPNPKFQFASLSPAPHQAMTTSTSTTTTSTPASSVPSMYEPSQAAYDAQPNSKKAAKPKRIRNNVGPKHQLEELQQVVAQKNQQIAQLLQENVRLKDTTGILELVIQCRNQQVIRLQQGIMSQDATGIATSPLATDTAALAAYARLTAPQLMATFKPVLNDMSVALLAAEDPSNAAGAASLAALMKNFHFVVQHVSLANTEILKTVGMTLSADNPENSDTHWAAVAISLNLSPKQQADSIILHDLYMRWTGRINAERHQCSCLLSAAMEASSKSHERAYSGSNQGYQPNDAELMEKMHKTVVQDRCLILLVGEVLTTRIMTHKQWARAVVQSYPFVLDVWALLRAVSGLYRTSHAS